LSSRSGSCRRGICLLISDKRQSKKKAEAEADAEEEEEDKAEAKETE